MKLCISTIPLLLFFWSINVESPKIKKDRICQTTNAELEKNWNKNFIGVWVNEADAQTRKAITKCKISSKNNSLVVQMWGSCIPQDCEWGENVADEVKNGTNKFELLWDVEFAESTITYEITDGKLKLTNKRRFKDNSGRPGYTLIEYFIKQ